MVATVVTPGGGYCSYLPVLSATALSQLADIVLSPDRMTTLLAPVGMGSHRLSHSHSVMFWHWPDVHWNRPEQRE